jgi:selenophosphate synthase
VAGGTQRNHASVTPSTAWGGLPLDQQYLLADAQTSGGLLIAAQRPDELEAAFVERHVSFARIGEVRAGPAGTVSVHGSLA